MFIEKIIGSLNIFKKTYCKEVNGNMLKLNQCPMCSGSLQLDSDYDGSYELCIQCGFMRDLDTSSLYSLHVNFDFTKTNLMKHSQKPAALCAVRRLCQRH